MGPKRDYCLKYQRSTSDAYYFRLTNKYECLSDPAGSRVTIDDAAVECLASASDYEIERCLGQYETANAGSLGFQADEWTERFSYGALAPAGNRMLASDPATDEEITPRTRRVSHHNFTDPQVQEYMCKGSEMTFYFADAQ